MEATTKRGQRAADIGTPDLIGRLVSVAERVVAAARERAAQPQPEAVPRWLRMELEQVEAIIRAMKTAQGFLTIEEGRRLAVAKDMRRMLRRQVEELVQPAHERNRGWAETARRIEQALKKCRRLPGEREQLGLLVANLMPLSLLLIPSDRRAVHEAARRLKILEAIATDGPAPAAPESRDDLRESEPAPEAFGDHLPPAAELEFDPADVEIVAQLAQGRLDDERDYRLNLAAAHLSLVGGFEALLCLPLLRGVEHFPFQVDTARQVLRAMRGRALLCDEVGLGKTIEAGLVLKEYLVRGLVRSVLVLAPPALVSQWREEMAVKFDVDFVTHEDAAFRALGTAAWERCDRVIASLHTAKQPAHSAVIHRQAYDLVIVDEAHHLKNRGTLSWKFVNGLKSKYLLLLTATPAQNDLDELFNLITLLSPGQLKTPASFRREFVERGDPRRPKNRIKLRELLMDVMVRNTRSQVQVVLPPRRAVTVRMTQTPAEHALYEATTRFVREQYRGGGSLRLIARTLQAEAGSSTAALRATLESMRLRETHRGPALDELCDLAGAVSSAAKADALLKILRECPEKVLVFTQYRETQRLLLEILEQNGIASARFSGELSAAEKDQQVAAFARDRKVLVSTDVGSEGRNLQFCHTILNYDLPWNPMKIEQRVGRVHRIGQTEPVRIFNLAARDTIEDYILEVLDEKINMFELVVGEVGEILGNLEDEREFEDIVLDLWTKAESAESARASFGRLGEALVEARGRYSAAKAYDDALFGQDFVPER
ncbi:MAG: SNF2-related protein [Candidatus Eisenbacteria bacterium]